MKWKPVCWKRNEKFEPVQNCFEYLFDVLKNFMYFYSFLRKMRLKVSLKAFVNRFAAYKSIIFSWTQFFNFKPLQNLFLSGLNFRTYYEMKIFSLHSFFFCWNGERKVVVEVSKKILETFLHKSTGIFIIISVSLFNDTKQPFCVMIQYTEEFFFKKY